MPGGGEPPLGSHPYNASPIEQPPNKGNIYGILALIFGIAAVVLSWCCGLGILSGIAATILGSIGMKKVRTGEADNKNLAVAGLILGIVGIVAGAIFCAVNGVSNWDYFKNQMNY
jgi:hypothetical protein